MEKETFVISTIHMEFQFMLITAYYYCVALCCISNIGSYRPVYDFPVLGIVVNTVTMVIVSNMCNAQAINHF